MITLVIYLLGAFATSVSLRQIENHPAYQTRAGRFTLAMFVATCVLWPLFWMVVFADARRGAK